MHLSAHNGALLVTEFGRKDGADVQAPNRWGVGLWNYSRAARRLDDAGTGRNAGAYALARWLLHEGARGRTVGFIRSGFANPHLDPIGSALDAGALVDRPWASAARRR